MHMRVPTLLREEEQSTQSGERQDLFDPRLAYTPLP